MHGRPWLQAQLDMRLLSWVFPRNMPLARKTQPFAWCHCALLTNGSSLEQILIAVTDSGRLGNVGSGPSQSLGLTPHRHAILPITQGKGQRRNVLLFRYYLCSQSEPTRKYIETKLT